MSTLERAIEIAVQAHTNQVDKGNQPYILHPLRVMLAVHTNRERMAAVLHDVIEDTPISVDDLVLEGFPEEVIDAVRALTKLEGESRMDAAKRVIQNPIAMTVKIEDVKDNINLGRIPNPTEADFARRGEYEEVLRFLVNYKDCQ
jgi:(p)ppGpp synthase/HD superfamily hydrolase